MKLSIAFTELQDYVLDHYHKELELSYVDDSTVKVATPVKVFGFSKSIGINLTIERIEGTDLYLTYDGKMGIELLVTPAISFIKKLVPEKTEMIQMQPDNTVKVSLGDIERLKKVLDKLTLQSIRFEPEGIVLEASLLPGC